MSVFHSIGLLIRALFRDRAELAVENLALRQQLAILKDKTKRPKLRPRDRVFWVWLSRFWANWRSALLVVQPDTVVRWRRHPSLVFRVLPSIEDSSVVKSQLPSGTRG